MKLDAMILDFAGDRAASDSMANCSLRKHRPINPSREELRIRVRKSYVVEEIG